MHQDAIALHASVSQDQAEDVRSGRQFQWRFEGRSEQEQDYWARVYVIAGDLGSEFVRTRIHALRDQYSGETPPPYDRAELKDLKPDEDFLVPVESFAKRDGLVIGDVVCEVAQTKPSLNSMYWTMIELERLRSCDLAFRLDPLLVCPKADYLSAVYLMTVYGVPLDWGRLAALKEPIHGRWIPEPGAERGVAFTDVVWSPRDDGVHFACEEVPQVGLADRLGARYFHSILEPSAEHFTHADGALRLYSEDELRQRHTMHLRKTGKAGTRAKIFRANGKIDLGAWCRVVAAFFVWNEDVQGYVGGKPTGLSKPSEVVESMRQ